MCGGQLAAARRDVTQNVTQNVPHLCDILCHIPPGSWSQPHLYCRIISATNSLPHALPVILLDVYCNVTVMFILDEY